MNKKAFMLVDSLVCIVITVLLSTITIFTYDLLDKHNDSYYAYYEEINDRYKDIYERMSECEKCLIKENTEEDL